MGYGANRVKMRKAAKARLGELIAKSDHVYIVHYSCESFFDNPTGASRRITSIAVLHLGSEQVHSFSIHQVAERLRGKISMDDIEQHYDDLEGQMLSEFYAFVAAHTGDYWVQWNMRDSAFGFPALGHRYQVLTKKKPVDFSDEKKILLPDLFDDIYGKNFANDPQLEDLMNLNAPPRKEPRPGEEPPSEERQPQEGAKRPYIEFLTGWEEAQAFKNKEYVKLHASTLRKVRLMRHFVREAWRGTLKTRSSWWSRAMETPQGVVENVTDHWLYKFAGGISLVAGLAFLIARAWKLL